MEMITTNEALALRARNARLGFGENQVEAGRRFGKHPQTINDAEMKPNKSLDRLRMDMIEFYEGVNIRMEVSKTWYIEPQTQNAVSS